jgi:hypothetical protein
VLTNKEKRKRVEDLKPEVGKLHPFLHVLLKHIPAVSDVRYTHGTGEFGADFILTKNDQSTERQGYIGVVV